MQSQIPNARVTSLRLQLAHGLQQVDRRDRKTLQQIYWTDRKMSEQLRTNVSSVLAVAMDISPDGTRAVVFVGHSLGGMVFREGKSCHDPSFLCVF